MQLHDPQDCGNSCRTVVVTLLRLVDPMDLSDCNVGRPEGGGLRSDPPHAPIKLLNGLREANIHSVVAIRHGVFGVRALSQGRGRVLGCAGNEAHGPVTKHDVRDR